MSLYPLANVPTAKSGLGIIVAVEGEMDAPPNVEQPPEFVKVNA